MLVFLAYGLLGGSALLLIWQDIQEQRISLPRLLLLMAATLLKQWLKPDWENFLAASAVTLTLTGCQGLFWLFRRKPAMGWGDLLLCPFCGFWLHLNEIPFFLINTGFTALLTGIFWRCKWGMRTFPMVPALFSGLGIVFLIRCFLRINGV